MSIEKAKEFLSYLAQNQEAREKMQGFTLDELREAVKEASASGELSDTDLDNVSGGGGVNLKKIWWASPFEHG